MNSLGEDGLEGAKARAGNDLSRFVSSEFQGPSDILRGWETDYDETITVGLQLELKKFNRIRLFVQQKQMQIRNGFQVIYQIVKLPEKMMVKCLHVTLSRNRYDSSGWRFSDKTTFILDGWR